MARIDVASEIQHGVTRVIEATFLNKLLWRKVELRDVRFDYAVRLTATTEQMLVDVMLRQASRQ